MVRLLINIFNLGLRNCSNLHTIFLIHLTKNKSYAISKEIYDSFKKSNLNVIRK